MGLISRLDCRRGGWNAGNDGQKQTKDGKWPGFTTGNNSIIRVVNRLDVLWAYSSHRNTFTLGKQGKRI